MSPSNGSTSRPLHIRGWFGLAFDRILEGLILLVSEWMLFSAR